MHRPVAPSRALRVVAVLLVATILTGPAVLDVGAIDAQVTNATNVTQHENPAAVDGSGDLDGLEGWLERHLAGRLEGHSIRVSRGQYEAAEGLVDDSFERRLGQLVDVAGEADGRDDPGQVAETFERVGESQRNVSRARREYERTFDLYRSAAQRDNTSAARRHARRLERLSARIDRNVRSTRERLRQIEDHTGIDMAETGNRLSEVNRNVTRTQSRVREDTFIETTLRVRTDRQRASYREPASLVGSVTATNATTVADRAIRVRVGGRTYTPTTDANGTFEVRYRPVFVEAGNTEVPVVYRPTDTAPYLESATNVSLSIDQVEANVAVDVEPDSTRFGEDVAVDGSVAVDGRAIRGVPADVRIAGRPAGSPTTDANGSIRVTAPVSASLSAGTVPVEASVAMDGRAIAPTSGRTTFEVRPSETALSIEAADRGDRVTVGGQLIVAGTETAGPAGQVVTVRAGDTVRRVRTGDDGSFEAAIPRSTLEGGDGTVRIEATFDGRGSNLAPSSAATTITVGGTAEIGDDVVLLGVVLAGIAAVALVGAWLVRRRLRGTPTSPSPPTDEAGTDAGSGGGSDRNQWLVTAREALSEDAPERAIASAYAAAYDHVAATHGLGRDRTPRELLAACEGTLSPAKLDSLATVTEIYERAVFAAEPGTHAGQRAIDAATEIVGEAVED